MMLFVLLLADATEGVELQMLPFIGLGVYQCRDMTDTVICISIGGSFFAPTRSAGTRGGYPVPGIPGAFPVYTGYVDTGCCAGMYSPVLRKFYKITVFLFQRIFVVATWYQYPVGKES